ncbi:unnamed protein product [Lactuca virosa]|uniref:Uncharacterized protein n=1 Tax=Lactuca virosa TaxID=75947 RepID=A0AAU9M5N2_9ASTR|nr:unnamed protein product [Lactuca virosa]
MFVRSSILGDSVSGDASLHRCSDYLLSKIVNHDHCLCLRSNIRPHRGLIALISDQHFPRDPSVRYSGTKVWKQMRFSKTIVVAGMINPPMLLCAR